MDMNDSRKQGAARGGQRLTGKTVVTWRFARHCRLYRLLEQRVEIRGHHADPVVEITRQAKDRVVLIENGIAGHRKEVGNRAGHGLRVGQSPAE